MSRIGKKPIALPKGVTVKVEGNLVVVQGPKGKLDTRVPHGIKVEQQDGHIVGIGYRAEMKGKGTVVFTLGYSHPIEYPLPTGIDVAVDPKQTRLTVTGIDRQKVGQVAAEMRALRPPDPYKNKGVRYAGERLKKKVGKTGAK
jgi:large subunit ribosomal protein L6